MREPWPLIGRQHHLDAFRDALARPDRVALLLHGPAGVGKSRLADECRALASVDHPVARVTASRAAATLPLGALAAVLPADLGAPTSPADLLARTWRRWGRIAVAWS